MTSSKVPCRFGSPDCERGKISYQAENRGREAVGEDSSTLTGSARVARSALRRISVVVLRRRGSAELRRRAGLLGTERRRRAPRAAASSRPVGEVGRALARRRDALDGLERDGRARRRASSSISRTPGREGSRQSLDGELVAGVVLEREVAASSGRCRRRPSGPAARRVSPTARDRIAALMFSCPSVKMSASTCDSRRRPA